MAEARKALGRLAQGLSRSGGPEPCTVHHLVRDVLVAAVEASILNRRVAVCHSCLRRARDFQKSKREERNG